MLVELTKARESDPPLFESLLDHYLRELNMHRDRPLAPRLLTATDALMPTGPNQVASCSL